MRKVFQLVVATIVVVLLAGCQPHVSAAVGDSPSAISPTAVSPTPTPTSNPIVAEPPANPLANCPTEVNVPTPAGSPAHITAVKVDGRVVFDVDMVDIGLDANGELNPNVPGKPAWFNSGVRAEYPPGYPGVSIVAGHASTKGGVFHNLPGLEPGDTVVVRYSSGDEVHFVANWKGLDLKHALTDTTTPLGAEIWDENRLAACRITWLITCDLTTRLVNGHRLGNVAVRLAFVSIVKV